MANIPDFRPQQQIDPMAIVNALGEKRRAEAQLQEQKNAEDQRKYQNIKDVIGSITNLTQGLITSSRERLQASARTELAKMMTEAKDLTPTGQGESVTVEGLGSVPTATMGTKDSQPDYLPKMQGLAFKANIKGVDEDVSKKLFSEEKKGINQLSGRDIQQKNIILKDGTRTSLQLFETLPSEKYGTAVTWTDLGGNEIDPATLEGALEAPAPIMTLDPFGNPVIVERVGAGGVKNVGTSTPSKTSEKTEKMDPENAYLRLHQKAPKLAANLKESVDKATVNNPVVAARVESINASRYAKGLLSDPNAKETELKSVYTYIARAVEKGALTEADKAAFSEPLSLLAKGQNAFYKAFSGEAGPKFKTSLIRLQERLEKRGIAELTRKINVEKEVMKKQLGRAWETGLDKMYPAVDELVLSMDDMKMSDEKGSAEAEAAAFFKDLGGGK